MKNTDRHAFLWTWLKSRLAEGVAVGWGVAVGCGVGGGGCKMAVGVGGSRSGVDVGWGVAVGAGVAVNSGVGKETGVGVGMASNTSRTRCSTRRSISSVEGPQAASSNRMMAESARPRPNRITCRCLLPPFPSAEYAVPGL